MRTKISERQAKRQITEYFPWCPFCCFERLQIDVKPERNYDYILCDNCGAKWQIDIQEKIKSAKLIATSVDRKGKDLLEKETEPKFWQNKAWLCVITRKIPERS